MRKVSQSAGQNSKFFLLLDDSSLDSNQSYQVTVQKIHSLGQAKDLKGLAQLADNIGQIWGTKSDSRGYFALMDVLTSVLASDDFGSVGLYAPGELTQKYVAIALAHQNVPLDITARLLLRLVPEEKLMLYKRPFNTAEWVRLRSARAPLWLQTRQRLKELIIPNYDFVTSTPMNNAIGLEASKNPKQAAIRRQSIQANNMKIQERNDQALARTLNDLFSPIAEEEAIFYYSQPPSSSQELKQLLDTYVDDVATKQRILDQVAKNIAAASQK